MFTATFSNFNYSAHAANVTITGPDDIKGCISGDPESICFEDPIFKQAVYDDLEKANVVI